LQAARANKAIAVILIECLIVLKSNLFLFCIGIPAIGPSQNIFHGICPGLFCVQLFRPYRPFPPVGPGAMGCVFCIESRFPGMGFVPIMPALWLYMAVHIAIDENGLGMVAPWAAQIKSTLPPLGGQPTVYKYQAVFPFLCGGGGREVTLSFGMDLAILEDSRRPSEDKVHRALDITIFIVLPGIVPLDIQGILMSQKTAVLKDR